MNDQVKIVTMTGVVMSSCPLLGAIDMNRMLNGMSDGNTH